VVKFAIVAEGLTDQLVIQNILLGYFEDEDEEPVINFVQPLPATTSLPDPPAGWTRVFEALRRGEPQKALQFHDYLVIHIDTDVQEEDGFGVSRREEGKELSIPQRIERVITRLERDIDAAFYRDNTQRFLFAVAVDTIECWLLPLLYKNKKAEKTTGCLEAANTALRKANKNGLFAGETKFPRAYDQASDDFTKRKNLMKHRGKNPSLKLFIKQLDDLQSRLTANRSAASQDDGEAAAEGEDPPENAATDQPG
jgi:hypothetical protein